MNRKQRGLIALALGLLLMLPMPALGETSTAPHSSDPSKQEPPSTTVIDPDTRGYWKNWETNDDASTRNIGRIWTDKTVQAAGEDNSSDFLTTFSAVSSTPSTVSANYPTQIESGSDASQSGYVTFTDELGEFMQVDDFTEAAIDGETFSAAAKSTNGNTDTYKFSGKAKDIVIEVVRASSDNPQQGDRVTVKIPASLIPLREYSIDKTAGTFTVGKIDSVSPIRVTYASSVKTIARQNLFDPSEVPGLSDYIENHLMRGESGNANAVFFLANKWSGGTSGNAIATFEPADTNSYYYFQKVTPIYTDEACTQRAMQAIRSGKNYYYKDEFITNDSGMPTDDYAVVEFDGSEVVNFEGALVSDSTGWAFSKGAARLAHIDQLHTAKTEVGGNLTSTATDVLDLQWNNEDATENATQVQSHLGNNGKIAFNLDTTPAVLDTKTSFGMTKVLEGRDWADEDEFTFSIRLDRSASSDPEGTDTRQSSATVTKVDLGEDGSASIDFGSITFTKTGTYVYEIRENVDDANSADGMDYSTNCAKITVAVSIDAAGKLSAVVSSRENTEFVNTYHAAPTSIALSATKVLFGRDLLEGEFSFMLSGEDGISQIAKNDERGNVTFNTLTFDAAGTYVYRMSEVAGTEEGMVYDDATYIATVTVTDDGKGHLAASVAYSKNGIPVNEAVFSGSYKAPETSDAPEATEGSDTPEAAAEQGSTLPATGDAAATALLVTAILSIAGLITMGACLIARRRPRS